MSVDLPVNFLHCTIESRNNVKISVVDNIGPWPVFIWDDFLKNFISRQLEQLNEK
jgi:hypothetical protein